MRAALAGIIAFASEATTAVPTPLPRTARQLRLRERERGIYDQRFCCHLSAAALHLLSPPAHLPLRHRDITGLHTATCLTAHPCCTTLLETSTRSYVLTPNTNNASNASSHIYRLGRSCQKHIQRCCDPFRHPGLKRRHAAGGFLASPKTQQANAHLHNHIHLPQWLPS